MQQKMSLRNHVYIILTGLTVAAISGYFLNLRKGDVEGFVKGIILVPTIVWVGNVMWFRYRASRALPWGVERIVAMTGPVKIGIKHFILWILFFAVFVMLMDVTHIQRGVVTSGGMISLVLLSILLASREAFRRGRQMGREEKD